MAESGSGTSRAMAVVFGVLASVGLHSRRGARRDRPTEGRTAGVAADRACIGEPGASSGR